ncbi:MAG: glycosyltransferase family 4 protein [Gammaproteobacteria bacterium]|nr:glycosyltransferase family 4 protein [Gammaproteobacteria bacterium]
MTRRILQICPHDSAPFGALCGHYVQAGGLLDVEVVSVFLAPPTAKPLSFAQYLNVSDLSQTKVLVKGLARHLAQRWDLILCHRYRAYWVVVKGARDLSKCVVIAHEYGLLSRWQRRLNRKLFARKVRFAGAAPGVAAELAQICGEQLVLPNVLDIERAGKRLLNRDAALETLGLAEQQPQEAPITIGVVGRLHYKKRPQLAVAAFELFGAVHKPSRLVFVGEGECRRSLEQHKVVATQARLELVGNIVEASQTFAAFDVLLHTGDVDAFGLVVLEAMVAGVPVVVGRGHGPEYVLAELGFYAENDTAQGYAAAIIRALETDREVLAQEGKKRAQELFSVPALARCLDGMLKPR